MFFSRDQEANEKSDAYLASLRRVAPSCEFAQLEEELIKDRIALGTKDGGVQAHMLTDTRSSSNVSKKWDNTAIPTAVPEAIQWRSELH